MLKVFLCPGRSVHHGKEKPSDADDACRLGALCQMPAELTEMTLAVWWCRGKGKRQANDVRRRQAQRDARILDVPWEVSPADIDDAGLAMCIPYAVGKWIRGEYLLFLIMLTCFQTQCSPRSVVWGGYAKRKAQLMLPMHPTAELMMMGGEFQLMLMILARFVL